MHADRYPFAICTNPELLRQPDVYPQAMLDAGARMYRLDATFAGTRPQAGDDPGQWRWDTMEGIKRIRQAYPDLQALMIFGYGAPWADDPASHNFPGGEYAGRQRGIDIMPPSDPENLYGHYVYETVKRYRDVVRYWESWNEPDLPGGAFFRGNGRDFFAYQKACYLAAKAADPDCTVLFAGLCFANVEGYTTSHDLTRLSLEPPTTCFFEEYLQECRKDPAAAANGYYFDIMNQHTYARATDLYDYTMVVRQLMCDYMGEEKPIWITEMGAGDQGGTFGMNALEYADYMLQSFAWGRLAGVERFFHFQLDNSNGHGLYQGSLGDPKPALTAYRDVLTREFAGTQLVAQRHGHAGIGFLEGKSPFTNDGKMGFNLFEFYRGYDDRKLWMAFTDTSEDAEILIPAEKPTAILIDRQNNRQEITARNGYYTLTLSGATNLAGWCSGNDDRVKALGNPEHLVGGATLVIVE